MRANTGPGIAVSARTQQHCDEKKSSRKRCNLWTLTDIYVYECGRTLRSEAGAWSIRLLLLTVFLDLTSRLQAGKLLVKVAAHTRSSCTIQARYYEHRNHKIEYNNTTVTNPELVYSTPSTPTNTFSRELGLNSMQAITAECSKPIEYCSSYLCGQKWEIYRKEFITSLHCMNRFNA